MVAKVAGYFALMLGIFVLVIGVVSAQTIVVGKAYNSDFSQSLEGAYITAKCNGMSNATFSLEDGTYGIGFDEFRCGAGSLITVIASYTEHTASASGQARECSGENCSAPFVAVVNLNLVRPVVDTPSRGGSGGSSVPLRAPVVDENPEEAFVPLATEAEDETSGNIDLDVDEAPKGAWGTITGAVVGTLGTGGTIGVIIFIVALIAAFIAVGVVRSRAK